MTTDREIYQAATLLIKEHDDEAPIHAAMRADELLDQGDIDGQAVWKLILKAVDDLLSEKVPADATVN